MFSLFFPRLTNRPQTSPTHVKYNRTMVPNPAPTITHTIKAPPPPPPPPLLRSSTLPAYARQFPSDRSLLTPEDAIYQGSPPRKQSVAVTKLKDLRMSNADSGDGLRMGRRHKDGSSRAGSRSRRRKGTWKKLLWVKQSCGFGAPL